MSLLLGTNEGVAQATSQNISFGLKKLASSFHGRCVGVWTYFSLAREEEMDKVIRHKRDYTWPIGSHRVLSGS